MSAEEDFNIVGETGDGLETVKLVEQLVPDVLILELMMGGINGLEVTRQLNKKVPNIGIVISPCTAMRLIFWRALPQRTKVISLKSRLRKSSSVPSGKCLQAAAISVLRFRKGLLKPIPGGLRSNQKILMIS